MIKIDKEKCNACGTCGIICPRHIPETIGENDEKLTMVSRVRGELCLWCGQCLAICPNDAIRLEGTDFRDFKPVRPLEVTEKNLITLMEQRRSVRRYKDKPVRRETLNRIIEASRRAPTGTGSQSTGVLIIDKPDSLEALSKIVHESYQDLAKALKNPIARFMIKRQIGYRLFSSLKNFVMPGMYWYLKWKREDKGDEILRDCKALILYHSPILEPMGETNCAISAFHGILMAEILGVGTCFNDLIPPVCNQSKEIRKLLGLAEDREIYSSVTVGFPKHKYRKIIPKRLAEVRYMN